MAVLFAGTEPEAFLASGNVGWSTTAAAFDADYSRGASVVDSATTATANVGSRNEVWAQARFRLTSASGTGSILVVRDSSGAPLAGVRGISGTLVAFHSSSASARIDIAPTVVYVTGTAYFVTLHVKWVAVNQLLVEFFFDGALISSATVTHAWIASKKPAQAEFTGNAAASSPTNFSEAVVTDTEDPRGWRVSTLSPNGNGALGEWAGSYVDVDEIGLPDDNDFISSDTAGQIELFAMSNLSAPAQNMTPVAVALSTRARVGTGGPQNIQPGIRVGGANFFGGNLSGLTPVFGPAPVAVWDTNPATSGPWSVADIQNLETGYKSGA